MTLDASDLVHETITATVRTGDSRDARVTTARSRGGTAIAFERAGCGSPLILVDGALCHRAMGPSTSLARLLARISSSSPTTGATGATAATPPPYGVDREIDADLTGFGSAPFNELVVDTAETPT